MGAFCNSAQSVLNKTCLCPEICFDRSDVSERIFTVLFKMAAAMETDDVVVSPIIATNTLFRDDDSEDELLELSVAMSKNSKIVPKILNYSEITVQQFHDSVFKIALQKWTDRLSKGLTGSCIRPDG